MRNCPQCDNPLPEAARLCVKCGAQIGIEPREPDLGGSRSGEVDLHGFSVPEAMEAFVRYYNREVRHTAPERIKVIHGYGASGSGGAIRAELRSLLERNQDKLTFVGGESIDGNPGYTVVYPGQGYSRLSTSQGAIYMGDQLAEEILQYCRQMRTEEKIAGKFRRYGIPEVKKTLKALEGQGKVRVVWKGKHKGYETVTN